MRNFPKQVTRIQKLRAAVVLARDLIGRNADLANDDTFGYTLAHAGVYTFSGVDPGNARLLEERIALERSKARSHQGAQTCARELRKTLQLLGFLEHVEGTWQISSTGSRLIAIPDVPDTEAIAIWRDALLRLKEERVAAHTARNMLRLIAAEPGLERRRLAFAFEMNNDSEAELRRALALVRTPDFAAALAAVGASRFTAANAVKVLPSLLEQTRLITIARSVCHLTVDGSRALSSAAAPPIVARPAVEGYRRGPRGGFAVTEPDDVVQPGRVSRGTSTAEQQIHSAIRLSERTAEHQQLVRSVVAGLHNVQDVRCSTDAFDVLCKSALEDAFLLFEAKTVDGDGMAQARTALGQLLFYEYFDVLPVASRSPIWRVAVFNAEPGQEAREFLAHFGVECVVFLESGMVVAQSLQRYFSG